MKVARRSSGRCVDDTVAWSTVSGSLVRDRQAAHLLCARKVHRGELQLAERRNHPCAQLSVLVSPRQVFFNVSHDCEIEAGGRAESSPEPVDSLTSAAYLAVGAVRTLVGPVCPRSAVRRLTKLKLTCLFQQRQGQIL